jgi:hypothetical protein
MTHLRFVQLYDHVVGTLYHLKLKNRHGFFSLKKILIDILEYPATADDVFQIGKYVEAKGFVKALFYLGDVLVEITPVGVIHWERDPNIATSFHSEISIQKIEDQSTHLQMESDTLAIRGEIFEKVNAILGFTDRIKDQDPDIHLDARIIDLEFHKIKPNHELLLNKLFSIDRLPPIRKEVLYLQEVLTR